ncbi:protein kinase, partial [Amnibacterium sp.]|uniref:protein kinase domain-containing protein n=1 Tax=Amnibacterium sp. TaxID=1872496 RepID=UPI00260B3127
MAGARTKLGDVVAGRYRLGSIAGRGGVGVVHRAADTAAGRDVQVTVLYARIRAVLDADRVEHLRGALRSLAHPALAVPIDVVVDPASVVTRPVEGRSLAGVLTDAPLGEAAVSELGAALADGLAALHACGVVHRWIRPSAVAVDADGRPVLLDIGVTELLRPQYCSAFERLIGTTAYVSPEQVWNEPVGPATDVYALGLVLLEALTGVPVYPGTTAADAVARTLVAPVVPDTADPRLARLLAAATAFRPEQRPSAAALAAGFRELLAPVPAPALATALAPVPTAAATVS